MTVASRASVSPPPVAAVCVCCCSCCSGLLTLTLKSFSVSPPHQTRHLLPQRLSQRLLQRLHHTCAFLGTSSASIPRPIPWVLFFSLHLASSFFLCSHVLTRFGRAPWTHPSPPCRHPSPPCRHPSPPCRHPSRMSTRMHSSNAPASPHASVPV